MRILRRAGVAPPPAAMCTVSGTTRSDGPASIITGRAPPARSARNSVCPGKPKPGGVERGLVDRVGDDGGDGPGAGERHRAGNAGDHRRAMLGIRAARLGRDPLAQRQYRQGIGEHAPRPRPDRRSRGSAWHRRDCAAAPGRRAPGTPARVAARRRQAASVISPPMPAGSPMVTARAGRAWSWPSLRPRARPSPAHGRSGCPSRARHARPRRSSGSGPATGDSQMWSSRRPRSDASQSCAAVGPPSVELLARRHHRTHRVDEAVGRLQRRSASVSTGVCETTFSSCRWLQTSFSRGAMLRSPTSTMRAPSPRRMAKVSR